LLAVIAYWVLCVDITWFAPRGVFMRYTLGCFNQFVTLETAKTVRMPVSVKCVNPLVV